LEIEIACSQWEGAASDQKPQHFNLGCGGRGERLFFLLLMCSYHFSKLFPKFSMCPPRMFLITPDFKLICFAQNPPLLTYIHGVFITMGISPGEKL